MTGITMIIVGLLLIVFGKWFSDEHDDYSVASGFFIGTLYVVGFIIFAGGTVRLLRSA